MRFVPVKSEETQGAASAFRVRELLIRQRTQAINALRGHLGEYGWVVPQGATNVRRPVAILEDKESDLPATARASLTVLAATLAQLDGQIGTLDAEIERRARRSAVARRLMTIPGIGPLIATALATVSPPPEMFRKGRDFAAWLGLTPRQHSTGGNQRLGATTTLSGHCVPQCPAGQRMGERSLRRLLIIGANSVIIKRHCHASAHPGTWLARMLEHKPPTLLRVALANSER